MKEYIITHKGKSIKIKASDALEAKTIYNTYMSNTKSFEDATETEVAQLLKDKNLNFKSVDGTGRNIEVTFANENDWFVAGKELSKKYRDTEKIKQGNSFKIMIGDSFVEDASTYTYQFPKFTAEDLRELKEYGLQFIKHQGEDTFVRGSLSNIKKYASEYLGYELHPDYLTKDSTKDSFSVDAINPKDYAEYGWRINSELERNVFWEAIDKGLSFADAKKLLEKYTIDMQKEFLGYISNVKKEFDSSKKVYEETLAKKLAKNK